MTLITLTGKHGIGKFAVVDDEDADLADIKWYVSKSRARCQGYPRSGKKYLHKMVARRMGIDSSIDHRNGDKHDSRRSNIRPATPQENNQNTGARSSYREKAPASKYCGVSWDKSRSKWMVHIGGGPRKMNLGRYDSEEEAAEVYNRAAKEQHGEFARFNIIR